ncbi:sensor histidine kinase [Acanthopleuribacter pedis]|uniref:histidine kinase n=1 Tax=Acanthopleuribacter pedis TaxID=442870 RepID=A0A8J7U204_9BACT|nr:HAMP domain-containing sensor histidine kinase [Acanthopleuribacter pedis]MBO1317219.1 phosphotransferase [Acanthopleuribacter pedis]MBO1318525.1 phosphotransferase [Acanthopleuribacter pedis]
MVENCACRSNHWQYASRTLTRKVVSSDSQDAYWRLLLEWYLVAYVGPAFCLESPRLSQDHAGAALTLGLPNGFGGGCGWQGAVKDLGHALEVAASLLDCVIALHRNGIIHGSLHPRNVLFHPADKKVRLLDFRAVRIGPFALDATPADAVGALTTHDQAWPDAGWAPAFRHELQQLGLLLKSLLAEIAQEFCGESEKAVLLKPADSDKNSDVRIVYERIVEPLLIEDNFRGKMSLQKIRRQLDVFLRNWTQGIPFHSMSFLRELETDYTPKATALSCHERIRSLHHMIQTASSASPIVPVAGGPVFSPAAVIHEVRNPNTLLRGALFHLERWGRRFEQLLSDLLEDEDSPYRALFSEQFDVLRDQLYALDRGTLQIESVLRGWSDVARERPRVFVPQSLRTVLKQVLALFRLRYHDGITFSFEVSDVAPVRAVHGALEQVFINLLLNACQAIVRRGFLEKGQGRIALVLEGTEQDWLVRIGDNGVGFDGDREALLNQACFTAPKTSGHGFGLAVCRRLLAEHHGSLTLSGELGLGCEALVRLPKAMCGRSLKPEPAAPIVAEMVP